jgi:hypothetical protein
MRRKKTAKKPAKDLKKKRKAPKAPAPVIVELPENLSDEEINQIKKDAQKLFDIEMFGTIEPTHKDIGLTLIKERMRNGE